MSQPARILVVDDEHSMREMVSILLKRNEYETVTADSGHQAIKLIEAGEQFDLVITDLLMDRGSGLDLLSEVKAREMGCEVIMITAFGTAESAVEAMKRGAFDYVTKPFNVDEFMIIVRQALERQALIQENIDLRARVRGEYKFADIVGRSQAMTEIIDLCIKAADSPATVLISGESGTGKEVVARALHFACSRAQAPFVAVNCGALPEQLMESELFGHEKGAFTGATEKKKGLFRSANRGTVFLDEIGELPAQLQVKMLRVLEDRRVRPVGSSQEAPVDIRIIAATNQDLEKRIKEGRFRTDLYYRLNVINIQLPPLRERTEDIPLLVEHLLARLSSEHGTPLKSLTSETMRVLLRYDYPGNVRQLSNILERAATLSSSNEIDVVDLPPDVGRHVARDTSQLLVLPDEGIDLETILDNLERSLISQALERTGDARTKAATLLGISFRSFRYRLSKLGLSSSENNED